VKRVPDTGTRIRIAAGGGDIERDGVKYVLGPYDEFAVEAALQLVEGAGAGEVTLLSFGPEATKESLRSGLALGAHRAVLLKGEPTMDGWVTARVLASELAGGDAALVLFGVKAVDDDQQQVGPMVAELLGRPCATSVVHDAGRPLAPSISTRHSRQEPKGSSMSLAQSFGILTPASAAARMTIVPSGTVTVLPSMVTCTIVADSLGGAPKSAGRR